MASITESQISITGAADSVLILRGRRRLAGYARPVEGIPDGEGQAMGRVVGGRGLAGNRPSKVAHIGVAHRCRGFTVCLSCPKVVPSCWLLPKCSPGHTASGRGRAYVERLLPSNWSCGACLRGPMPAVPE